MRNLLKTQIIEYNKDNQIKIVNIITKYYKRRKMNKTILQSKIHDGCIKNEVEKIT